MAKKMTKKRAIEIAIAALCLEVDAGHLQGFPYDDALSYLWKFCNIDDIIHGLDEKL